MDTFLVIIRKVLPYFGISIEEEDTSSNLQKDGSQNISDDSISSQISYALLSEVSSSDMSIDQVIAKDWLPACLRHNCLDTLSGINYDETSKEILIYPQKTSSEPDSNSVKRTVEPATSSHSDTPISSPANAASVPSNQLLGSSGNGIILAETDSSPNILVSQKALLVPQKINSDDGDDSSEGEFMSWQNTISESDSKQLESKKEASSSQKCKAKKLSFLNIPNEHLIGESSRSSHSDPLSFNNNEQVCCIENDVSAVSSQGTCENEQLLAATVFLLNLLGLQKTNPGLHKINYDDDAIEDSSKEKLICPQNRVTESDSKPLENMKKAACHQREAIIHSLLNIRNEQLIEASSKSSYSDTVYSNSIEHVSSNANEVGVPSIQVGSESEHLLIESDSSPKEVLQEAREESSCAVPPLLTQQLSLDNESTNVALEKTTVSGYRKSEKQEPVCIQKFEEYNGSHNSGSESFIYYDDGDSLKEKVTSPQKKITYSDARPLGNKKKASKGQRKAMKISLLNIQNEQLTGESSTSSPSGPLKSDSTEPIGYTGNDISVPSRRGSSENGPMFIETESLSKVAPQNITLSINGKPNNVMMWVAKEKSSCANDALDKTKMSGILKSEVQKYSCNQNFLEENNGVCESLGPDSFIHYDDADSSIEKQIFLQKLITEPGSKLFKSKKKALKHKGEKVGSQKEKSSSKASCLVSGNTNVALKKTTLSGHLQSEFSAALEGKTFGSLKTRPVLPKKTSFIDSIHKGKLWVPKEKSCSTDELSFITQSHNLVSCSKTTCLVSGSTDAALKKTPLSEQLISEPCAALDDHESGFAHFTHEGQIIGSLKTLIPQKATSDIDSTPKEVKIGVAKEKSIRIGNLISTEFVPSSKTSCLVSGCTHHDAVKKTISTALDQSEFGAASEEQEYQYFHNSLNGSKGSQLCYKVRSSSTNVAVVEKNLQGYSSSHKILLVGEGNFSFSACLARAFDSATNMVATSLNSEAYLECNYEDAMKNISELKMRGCKVYHEVDATKMANQSIMTGQSFDTIIYNFPHCGDFSRTEKALRNNQALVRQFMKNSSKMIKEDGEIHIRHKITSFFSQWNLRELASEAGLVLSDEAPFNFRRFKGYNPKYGFEGVTFKSGDNFCCRPCHTYKFALPNRKKTVT